MAHVRGIAWDELQEATSLKTMARLLVCVLFLLPCAFTKVLADEVNLGAPRTPTSRRIQARRNSYGQSSRLRIKGIQMPALSVRFNGIKGWKIESATLLLRYAGADRSFETWDSPPFRSPWSERNRHGGEEARRILASSGAGRVRRDGRGPRTDFTDVSYTAGQPLRPTRMWRRGPMAGSR